MVVERVGDGSGLAEAGENMDKMVRIEVKGIWLKEPRASFPTSGKSRGEGVTGIGGRNDGRRDGNQSTIRYRKVPSRSLRKERNEERKGVKLAVAVDIPKLTSYLEWIALRLKKGKKEGSGWIGWLHHPVDRRWGKEGAGRCVWEGSFPNQADRWLISGRLPYRIRRGGQARRGEEGYGGTLPTTYLSFSTAVINQLQGLNAKVTGGKSRNCLIRTWLLMST
jgi:hypothetical protein